ncbi:hypothetical protein MLD38_034064 [Melastoma candidum]|uniref:Uncharacterized protein n=1 Tax=Melastoma candidum TaxID=119954 RepID=A0ACB9M995_9MYRT|nr:hypothetical protein MLD38_034064 [Melastoma candidum]
MAMAALLRRQPFWKPAVRLLSEKTVKAPGFGLLAPCFREHAMGRRPSPAFLWPRRFESTVSQEHLQFPDDDDNHRDLDFPGGKVAFTDKLSFLSGSAEARIPCYRVLDDSGHPLDHSGFSLQVKEELAVKIYERMVTLQMMDVIFYEAQRQGRLSFYLTTMGEEAINIASAAALKDEDVVLPQYREPGILLWRGFTLQEFANQLFGNEADYGKGRQMPIHYGSNKHNYFTVSSPIATQLPQAVGVAYALKMEKKDACAVTYMGDGGTSEGDFHASLNFAAVTESPVIFICRNNGWAISTHINEQFRSDGVAVKGRAYGIRSIRVDGNDALAVYDAVHHAREISVKEQVPILIEALTYRIGHHSTSDDSTKYRPVDEINYWKNSRNPVSRLRRWVERNGWWCNEAETRLRTNIRKQLLEVIGEAEKLKKPPMAELFADVYDTPSSNLVEQQRQLAETVRIHSGCYPPDVPV